MSDPSQDSSPIGAIGQDLDDPVVVVAKVIPTGDRNGQVVIGKAPPVAVFPFRLDENAQMTAGETPEEGPVLLPAKLPQQCRTSLFFLRTDLTRHARCRCSWTVRIGKDVKIVCWQRLYKTKSVGEFPFPFCWKSRKDIDAMAASGRAARIFTIRSLKKVPS